MTDDNADDDGYKALRSVWLSMPDEDPPDRGLSELMAAARQKANEMADEVAKPSLWQRIAAMLRRPPVLALATLMVVLGGAALLGRHRDKLEVSPTVSAPTTPAREVEQTIVAGSGAPPASVPVAEPAPEPEQEAEPAPAMEPAKKDEAQGKAATPPPPPPPREPPKHHASATRSATTAAPHGGAAAGPTMADKNGVFMAPQAEIATDDAAPATPSATQLHKSARDAAARGDCDTVTRLKRKIESIDAHYYKTNVANDSKLAVCKTKN